MEIVGIERELTIIEALKAIHSIFPSKELINWKESFESTFLFDGKVNLLIEIVPDDFKGFAIQIETNESEFKTRINLFRTPEVHTEERELFIAFKLSQQLNCRTIITAPRELADHPYCSVIIDNDKMFEANDVNTKWADGEGGLVKIVRQIYLTIYAFDAEGNIIQ